MMIEIEKYEPAADKDQPECNCGGDAPAIIKYRAVPVEGKVSIAGREIEKISPEWSIKDYLGEIMARFDINPAEAGGRIIDTLRGIHRSSSRMNYAVKPGLYALGNPDKNSPVLVSANYKLSFDILRRDAAGLDAWILVLDTRGVNVWCAAGKGTFGTKELAAKIYSEKLGELVSHKKVIVPQLGAPGVCAQMVKMYSEFDVIYGPVRAVDIKEFLKNGTKADEKMRKVMFNTGDRLTVAWLELAMASKMGLLVTIALIAAAYLIPGFARASKVMLVSLWAVIISGTLLVPVLLPVLRSRAFSIKGALLGLAMSVLLIAAFRLSVLPAVSLALAVSAATAYLAANFTGASTYTSLSGVKKELKYAIPAIIGSLALSMIIGIASLFIGRA